MPSAADQPRPLPAFLRRHIDAGMPQRVGSRLWLANSTFKPPGANEHVLSISTEKGVFGNAEHATTALLLEWLDAASLDGKRVLDFGCGSGILAVAAALLGAEEVVGVDILNEAIEVSSKNARAHGVMSKTYFVRSGGYYGEDPFDVVLVNLRPEQLMPVVDELDAALRPGGRLVVSGIHPDELDSVSKEMGRIGSFVGSEERRGWVRAEWVKRGAD